MKILVVTTSYPKFSGDAAGCFIENACAELVGLGHEVKVVCPHATGLATNEVCRGVEVKRFRYGFCGHGERVAYGAGIPANLKSGLLAKLMLPFFMFEMLRAIIRESKGCDLIHAHWLVGGWLASRAAIVRKIPLVVTLHKCYMGLAQYIFAEMARKSFAVARQVFCVSDSVRERALAAGCPEGKLHVLWNGIELPDLPDVSVRVELRKKLGVGADDLVLLAAGRLAQEKDYSFMLRSFAKVVNDMRSDLSWMAGENLKYPKLWQQQLELAENVSARGFAAGLSRNLERLRLIVLGDGPEREMLSVLAGELDVAELVEFRGEVKRQEVFDHLAMADVFIMTSRREGLPTAMLEAMASGLPVLACDADGVRDLVVHMQTGLLFPHEPEDMVAGICHLANSAEERDRLGSGGRGFILQRGLLWRDHALRLENIYRHVIGESDAL